MPRVAHELFLEGCRWLVVVATFGQKLELRKQ